MSFAADLLERFPYDGEIQDALSSAVLEKTGFGSVYNHLTEAEKFVKDQLSMNHMPPPVRRWLQSLDEPNQAAAWGRAVVLACRALVLGIIQSFQTNQ